MDLQGQTAVVTGAGSGIGRALAHQLHGHGARLLLADRDVEALERTAAATDGLAVPMDVASVDDNRSLATAAGAPRLLCLNAGVTSTWTGPVWEAPAEEWHRVIGINLGGVVNGLRAFVPTLLATGETHHILITASLAGLATWPGGGPYAASKHAVVTVAEQTALALADHPITVTVLCPALVRTGMSDHGDDPAEVAMQALQAVDEHRFVVLPDTWTQSVAERGHRLAEGQPPRIPTPLDLPATTEP